MCKGRALITVDRDVVEGACGGPEVLPVGLLMRPRSDRSRSCERVTAQMELNRTIEETHHLQSSQSVLLQVLEAKFEHFITDHWRPMQAVVQHSRVHLPCTSPLHLAAQRPSPSPASSSCPLPQRRPDSRSGSGPDGFVTAQETGSGSSPSVLPLVSRSPSLSNSPSPIPTLFRGRAVFIHSYLSRPALSSVESSLDDEDESHSGGEADHSS